MRNQTLRKMLFLFAAGVLLGTNIPSTAPVMQVEAAEDVTGEFTVAFENAYAEVGTPLNAKITKVAAGDTVSYQWYVDGKAAGTADSYTPTEADLNSWIELQATVGANTLSAKMYFSKLPVVYIDTEGGQAITSKENYIDANLRVQGNAEFDNSKNLYDGVTEIRGRGNSTWSQPKKPYRLKLDKKTDMFGMGEGTKSKHWVLLANYLDESLLRNTLAYDMSGELGMEHLSTVWVDVIMNGEYAGNYQFCENIRVDEDRVDIFDWESYAEDAAAVIAEAEAMDEDATDDLTTYMAEESMQWITSGSFSYNGKTYKLSDYESALLTLTEEDYGHALESIDELDTLIDGGYILELDEYYDEVSKFRTNSNQPIMFKNPEFVYTNTDMMNYVQTYVQAFEDAVQADDYMAEYDGADVHYSELYDFEELIDYWLVTEIFYNEEINKKSTYMYKPNDEKMIMGPIWDMDWSAGAGGTSTGATNQWATNYFSVNAQANQWYKDLVQDPYFLMKVQERYWEIRDVQVQDMLDLIDVHIDYLKESGHADYETWLAKAGRSTSFESDSANLKNWLNTHVTWMDGQMETEDSFAAGFFTPSSTLKLTLTDKNGAVATEDMEEKAPADALVGTTDDVVLKIEAAGLSGNAQIFVNGKSAATVALSSGSAEYTIASALLTEEKDVKNVVEVKVKDNSGNVAAANFVTVKKTDCVHSYGDTWKSDETTHWKECKNGCGYTSNAVKHQFEWKVDKEATKEEPGIRHEECKVCGFKRNENTKFDYVEAPSSPSDDSKDISVDKMVAISETECSCSASEGPDDFILDGNSNTYWHTNHSTVADGTYLEKRWVGVSLNEAADVYGIRFLPRPNDGNGQVTEYKVQYRATDDGEWIDVASGTWERGDGSWKYVAFDTVTAKQVRIVGVHTYSNNATDRHMTCAEFRVVGVTDDTPSSGGDQEENDSPVIPVSQMIAIAGDAQSGDEAVNAIDEDEKTVWHTNWAGSSSYENHWLQIELKNTYKVDGLRYLPRMDSSVNGVITKYEVYTSLDGNEWTKAAEGTWTSDKEWHSVSFEAVEANYVKLVSVEAKSDNGKIFTSAAEVRLTGTADGEIVTPPSEEITVAFKNAYAEAGKALSVETNASGNVSYKWYVGGKQVGTESTYTPTAADLEKWIEVDVSGDNGAGSVKMYFSKLPVVYIDTEGGQAITSKEIYIDATIKLQGNAQYSDSKVLYEGATEIRGRGNSTWSQPKKPYRLKLDKKTDAFGMGKSKHWVLLANYLDESLMRNTLAYNLSGSMDMEQMSTVWVDVIMNGEYAGNYQFCENIRTDEERVDIFDWESFAEDTAAVIAEAEAMDEDTTDNLTTYMAEESMQWITSLTFSFDGKTYKLSDYAEGILTLLEEDYGHTLASIEELPSLITGGYILELDEYYDEVSKFKTDSNQPIMFKNPEFVNTNTDMMQFVKTYVQAFENAVGSEDYTAKYEDEEVHYSELYDFDALVDYWLISEIFFNEELNKKSTYMYKEIDELMKMGPIWDMDWSSGGEGDTKHTNKWATLHFNANAQANQWYKYLVQDPYFLMRAQERYWEIRDVQVQDMLDVMDDHYEYLKESGAADGTAWGKGDKSFVNDYTNLNTWLNTHVAWMDEQMETEDRFDASFLTKNQALKLALLDMNEAVLEKDTAEIAPADAVAAKGSVLLLQIKGVAGEAEIFINGKSCITLTATEGESLAWILSDYLTAKNGQKNVIEVKVSDANGQVTAANYVTVKTYSDEVVDKTALQEKVEEAEAIDTDGYTEESVAALTEVITAAKAVLEDEEATAEEVAKVLGELQDAMDALVKDKQEVCEVFPDVKHGAWYEASVQYVFDKGLMTGSNGLFKPGDEVSRAQFVTTLYRLAGSPAVTDDSACEEFPDVQPGKYYTDPVCWAYANGITTGSNGMFNTTGKLSRQQLATFLYRFAEYMGCDVTAEGDYSDMLNADQVAAYAEKAMKWAVGAGIISGSQKTDATGATVYDLNPKGNTTRAQLAAILERFCEGNNL